MRVRYDMNLHSPDFSLTDIRQVLYNYLYAQSQVFHNTPSKFLLTVNDTTGDKALIQEKLNMLKWLGITWDETPNASKRTEKYLKFARSLIEVSLSNL